MNPPYEITQNILVLISTISEKLGRINAKYLDKPSPKLRKENRIQTIHSSLKIEGNTLSTAQITALFEKKRVIGPEKDITEVLNAMTVYKQLNSFDPYASKSFLHAHKLLMGGLVTNPGTYRKTGVGIVAGEKITHMAPPAGNVPFLMNNLFTYLRSKELALIKSCVFHYEMEFIHPFLDGNGRMGRLWQTLILMKEYPVFEFIPFENLIQQTQSRYYQALSKSDKLGKSTPFIEYMLEVIDHSLNDLLDSTGTNMTTEDRLNYFSEKTSNSQFTRKDYMQVFREISSATASRDLKAGVDLNYFQKSGDKKNTVYTLLKQL